MAASKWFLICTVASNIYASRGTKPTCLPNAILETARKSIDGVNMPIGLFNQNWDSAQLVTHVALLLMSEAVGYNTILSGLDGSGSAAPIALAACTEDAAGLHCGSGPVPDTNPHHAAFEVWRGSNTQAAPHLTG